MTGVELLEALNPVPEFRGNPGPVHLPVEAPRPKRRVGLLLTIAATALLLAGLGSLALRPTNESGVDLDIASQGDRNHQGTSDEGDADQGNEDERPERQLTPPLGFDPATVPTPDLDPNHIRPSQWSGAAPSISAQAVARLVVPAIDVDLIVVDGVDREDLRRGPGHYPDSAFPGQVGNAAIAGLRTTYGALFHRLDELGPGDPVFVTTAQGVFEYIVDESKIVHPNEISVLQEFGDNRLTLTTQHPPYSYRQRLVVIAKLVGDPAPTSSLTEFGDGTAARLQITTATAPDIDDLAFESGRQPYYSYYGSTDALQTAWGFVYSQFPDWDHDKLSLAVHENTVRSVSVRWVDTAHNTAGWIVLSYGDGQFWVFEMTMDGVQANLFGTPDRARGSVTSDRPAVVEVMAPLASWADPGRPVPQPRATTRDALTSVAPAELSNGLTVDIAVDDIDDVFQEVRFVVRGDDGAQIGGVASSMVQWNDRGFGLVIEVSDLADLEGVLHAAVSVERWVVTDRFQTVEQLLVTAPALAPESVDQLPGYLSVRVEFTASPTSPAQESAFTRDVMDRFDRSSVQSADGTINVPDFDISLPASVYVVEELPAVARCVGWPTSPSPRVVRNQVRNVALTPKQALRLPPLALQGSAIEFTSVDGTVLGYAQAAPDRPWTFVKVIAVGQVDGGGWVVDRWEDTGC